MMTILLMVMMMMTIIEWLYRCCAFASALALTDFSPLKPDPDHYHDYHDDHYDEYNDDGGDDDEYDHDDDDDDFSPLLEE